MEPQLKRYIFMIFGLFKKFCPVCDKEVEKDKGINRFGKYLCSEEHAEQYRKQLAKEESKAVSGGKRCSSC